MPHPNAADCITAEVIARLNRPTGSAVGLPRDVYISPDFYELELERDRVLAATWVCVGGSTLFWEAATKDYIAIAAGTLDAPTGLTTAVQIHVESAGDYCPIDERIPERPP